MYDKSSVSTGHYLTVIRRRWKIVTALGLAGLLAVIAYMAVVPGKVMASTLVNVNVIVSDPFTPSRPASGLLDAATENELASSYVVAKEAAQAVPGGDTAEQLRDGISVSTGTNATTVRISYTSGSAERARSGADAMANSYLAYRQSQADARKTKMVNQLQDELLSLGTDLKKSAATDRSAISTRMSNVEFQINQLTAIDTTGGAVITPAAANPVTSQPQVLNLLAAGLLIGLVLGVIAAFVVNALDGRVRDAYDVDHSGAGPLLADLDDPEGGFPPHGSDLDALRAVREQLLAAADPRIEVVTVVDATQGAATDVGPNLAVVLAQGGNDVELVIMGRAENVMDLLIPSLSLVPMTAGAEGDAQIFASGLVPGLTVTHCDRSGSENDNDAFVTDAVLNRTTGRAPGSIVVLSLPAEATAASRLAAGRLSDCALLVGEKLRTRSADLKAMGEQMRDAGVALVGVALVRRGRSVEPTREAPRSGAHRKPERESVAS